MIYRLVTRVIQYFCFPERLWTVGTSWISRKRGILEKGGVWPPLPTMPLSTTLWNLLFKKLLRRLKRFPDIPTCSSLKSNPSCHTLSNALDISRKFALTSRVGSWSKLAQMSWTMDSNWLWLESDEWNLDWCGQRRLFSSRNSSIGSKAILLKILLHTGNNETGW